MQIGNDFFLNMFGAIANLPITAQMGGADFIPTNANGGTLQLTGPGSAAWLGMKNKMMQKYAYENCFPLGSVVDRLADFDISGKVSISYVGGKSKGNDATNSWAKNLRRLFARPNPLQSWEQFRGQQIIYKKVFGFCPVLPIIPEGMGVDYTQAIINLPPWLFFPIPVPVPNIATATQIEELVQGWRMSILGRQIVMRPNDVIILDDGYMQDEMEYFILPKSRLVGLDMAISNLCYGFEADNVLLRRRGPIGFITHVASKDNISGYLPMTEEQQQEIQTNLQQYGISWQQYQYMVTRIPTKWESMGYDVKQLGTKETISTAERAICHRYAFPYVLYEEQDATYANAGNAKKSVYQDNVIPNAAKDYGKYSKFFQAQENGCIIDCNFDHVSVFQEDAKFKGDAAYANDQALEIEWLNNVITLNQWRIARGYETTSDGDVYFRDVEQAEEPVTGGAGELPTKVKSNGHQKILI